MNVKKVLLGLSVLMMPVSAMTAHAAEDYAGTRYIKHVDATHTESVTGTLVLDKSMQQLSFAEQHQPAVVIPYAGIDVMRLDNTISRLRRPFTQRIARDEFLTVEYHAGNEPQYAVFKLSGKSYREVRAALEAQTGKRIEYNSN